MHQVVKLGTKAVMQDDSPDGERIVVFEDDGDTGYFYAVAPGEGGLVLLDALHVYNAEADLRGVECRLELVWSKDSKRAGLRVNGSLWAAFDFDKQEGRSRSNFPPPAGAWPQAERLPWDDALIHWF